MSNSPVPGSINDNVVRRNTDDSAENPVTRKDAIDILEEWTARGVVAVLSATDQAAGNRAVYVLPALTHGFLAHYFHLERAERKLAARVREKRRGRVWKATRQIELERRRLGRELHTGVGQMLAAMRLQLELISSHTVDPSAAVRQAMERLFTLVHDALEEVRSVSRRLHPPDWQRLSLAGALKRLWEMSGVPEAYQAAFQIDSLSFEPDLDRKTLIYRCLQEALSNITRHSRAKHVDVRLQESEDRLILRVADDGVGFDAERQFSGRLDAAPGIGLQSVREHAAALGGKLEIESGPLGTKLNLTVPAKDES